jgi:hypothetical protein
MQIKQGVCHAIVFLIVGASVAISGSAVFAGCASPDSRVNCGLKCISFLHWLDSSSVSLKEIEKHAARVAPSNSVRVSVADLVEIGGANRG